MVHNYLRAITATLALVLLMAGPAGADTIVFPVEGYTTTGCGDTWMEQGCQFEIATTTAQDWVSGVCLAFQYSGGILLMGCRVYVELFGIGGVETVEVDILEANGADHTRAFVYADIGGTLVDAASSTGNGAQTLVLNGTNAFRFAVSGTECVISEIRVSGAALTPIDSFSWGAIKALY